MYRKISTVLLLAFLLSGKAAQSQHKFKIEADFGAALPTNKDLKEIFVLGLSASIGPSVAVVADRFYIKPTAGLKWFYKEIEEVNSVTEHIRTWKAGVELQYVLLRKNEFRVSPLVRLDHNWLSNYYSETHNFNPITNTSTTATSGDLFKGKAFSTTVGLMASMEHVYFKVDHEFFSPSLSVNPDILNEAMEQGFIINPKQSFNFNSLTISLGYAYLLR